MKPETLHKGKLCNFKNQSERLVFLGRKFYPGDPRMWFQFAKVESPDEVWAEILQETLKLIEETPEPITTLPEETLEPGITLHDFKATMKLAEQDIAQYVSQRLHELQTSTKVNITGVNISLITLQTVAEPFPTIGGATATIYFEI